MEKRQAFGNLITLLYKLNVTEYLNIPVVSNPYYLVKMSDLDPTTEHL